MDRSRWIVWVLCLLGMPALCSQADTLSMVTGGDKEYLTEPVKSSMRYMAEIKSEYNDNVYRLSDSDKLRVEARDQEDMDSGRLDGMESVSDVIVSTRLGIEMGGQSPLGGKFNFYSWGQYHTYKENTHCDYGEFKLGLKHSHGKKGRINLEIKYLDGFFRKNYLSDVHDINGNGNISREERTYSKAMYNEFEYTISYKHNILKNKNNMISLFNAEPYVGGKHRNYNSSFSNRNRNIVFSGLDIRFEFFSKLNLEMTGQFENISSPNHNEIRLYDETVDSVDVNEDGHIQHNAALMTRIDRSCTRYALKALSSIEITKNSNAFIGYRWRISDYLSKNILDTDHFNQRDTLEEVRIGLAYGFLKNWTMNMEYRKKDENSTEDEDYRENRYIFEVRYEIKGCKGNALLPEVR